MRKRTFTIACQQLLDLDQVKPDKWAFILHDKDSGHPHYHYYLDFDNARDSKTLAKKLDIAENFIEFVKFGKKGILEYLTHQNHPDKYQYESKDIQSNFVLETEIQRRNLNFYEVIKIAKKTSMHEFCTVIQENYNINSNLSSLNSLLTIWKTCNSISSANNNKSILSPREMVENLS